MEEGQLAGREHSMSRRQCPNAPCRPSPGASACVQHAIVNHRPMRIPGVIGLCGWLGLLGPVALGRAQPTDSSDWPRYGHDGALTGRSPLHGNISKPRTAWSYSTAGRELLIEVVSAQGGHRLKIGADEMASLVAQPARQTPAPRLLALD